MSVLPVIGDFYIANYHGIAWRLTAGPGSPVIPTLGDGPMTQYPVPGQTLAPTGQALWRGSCGHGWDTFLVQRDFDSATGKSVAVIMCPICSVTLHYVEPYEAIYDPLQFPIIVG